MAPATMAGMVQRVTRPVRAFLMLLLLCTSLEGGMVSARPEAKRVLDLLSAVKERGNATRTLVRNLELQCRELTTGFKAYVMMRHARERGVPVNEVHFRELEESLQTRSQEVEKQRVVLLHLMSEQRDELFQLRRLLERSLLSEAARVSAWRSVDGERIVIDRAAVFLQRRYFEVPPGWFY